MMDLILEEDGDDVVVHLNAENIRVESDEAKVDSGDVTLNGNSHANIQPPEEFDLESMSNAMAEGTQTLLGWVSDRGGCLDSEATFIKRAAEGRHYFPSMKRWEKAEDKAIVYLCSHNLNKRAIAQRIGRSVGSINSRINTLAEEYDIEPGNKQWYNRHKEDWTPVEEELAEKLLELNSSHAQGIRWDKARVAFLLGRSCAAIADRKPQTRKREKHNERWTALDWGRLLFHLEQGRSFDQISNKLGRKENAIKSQLYSNLRELEGHSMHDRLKDLGRQYELHGDKPDPLKMDSLTDKVRDLI